MTGFLKWFFVFMTEMLKGFSMIFKGLWNGIKQIFNIKNYIQITLKHQSLKVEKMDIAMSLKILQMK